MNPSHTRYGAGITLNAVRATFSALDRNTSRYIVTYCGRARAWSSRRQGGGAYRAEGRRDVRTGQRMEAGVTRRVRASLSGGWAGGGGGGVFFCGGWGPIRLLPVLYLFLVDDPLRARARDRGFGEEHRESLRGSFAAGCGWGSQGEGAPGGAGSARRAHPRPGRAPKPPSR